MPDMISTRAAYGKALRDFGSDERIIAIEADLSICTMSCDFQGAYPERHFNIGIAEANMIGIAAGFASCDRIPFCHSFAMFTAGRCYEQVRNSVAYPGLNVKLIGSHAGITVGEDGPTHQCIEDLSLMRTIPGMVVLSPCDANETRCCVKAMIDYNGPIYMRTGRTARPCVTQDIPNYSFEIGKAVEIASGNDATIIATGMMVQEAMKAVELLRAKGISVGLLDMHTIKPIDVDAIIRAADSTGAIVSAEEHNIIGGLGSAIAEVLSAYKPIPLERVGINDTFGHSGEAGALLKHFGLTPEDIVDKVQKVIRRKNT